MNSRGGGPFGDCKRMNSRDGPPLEGCMLMSSRGRPPTGWWNLEVDPPPLVDEFWGQTPFLGCMLMNCRGGPTHFERGSASGNNFYGSNGSNICPICHCVPQVCDFALRNNSTIFFWRKLRFSYISLDLFGIWFWAVENLGSSHHASVHTARWNTIFSHIYLLER